MKNYASARAGRGKIAYRTPSLWRYRQTKKIDKIKNIAKDPKSFYDKKR
ncbi:MAG: hypothetical protein AAB724_01225 [Patescibacteria group bacterium]